MKIIKTCGYGASVLLLSMVAACSSTTDPSEAYKGESAEHIFQNGEKALRDKDYSEAIKRFEALDVQYPLGRNTETAQLHIIYAYYKNGDYTSAEAAADRFIHAHPASSRSDYAYYMRGLSNYYHNLGVFDKLFSVDYATRDLTQIKKSFADFQKLESQYPQSPYAPAARQYMVYLRNLIANHQVEVAQYYFDRQAYAASANRASVVVQYYQGSPVMPDALVLMAKSYHQLHQTQLEAQTIQIIRLNYPGSRYQQDVSPEQINDTNFTAATKKEKMIPPPLPAQASLAPPTAAHTQLAYEKAFPANGTRGIVRPVGEMVKELRSSELFALHNKTHAVVETAQNGMREPHPVRSMSAQNQLQAPVLESAPEKGSGNQASLAPHAEVNPMIAQNGTRDRRVAKPASVGESSGPSVWSRLWDKVAVRPSSSVPATSSAQPVVAQNTVRSIANAPTERLASAPAASAVASAAPASPAPAESATKSEGAVVAENDKDQQVYDYRNQGFDFNHMQGNGSWR